VAFAPEALQKLDGAARASGSATSVTGAATARTTGSIPGRSSSTTPAIGEPGTSAPSEGGRRATRPVTVPKEGDHCAFCKGALPVGRAISFCPHCGQDMTVVHCPACGSELERGWKFCVTCGRNASSP
jgi:hypothetical protein